MKIFLAHEETGFANVDGNWRIAADRDDYSDDVDYKETLGEYVLPEGYMVRETGFGPWIFSPEGQSCDIITHDCGRPQLIPQKGKWPVLCEVDKEA